MSGASADAHAASTTPGAERSTPADVDRPYDWLAALPRTVWLPALVTSAGERGARLTDTHHWLIALDRGDLPPPEADFGDACATAALRAVVGELGLPPLARGVPALAEQVLRTLLWHLDRLVDLQPRLTRAAAIDTVATEFRAAWSLELHGLEQDLALLQGLGDLAHLRWDELRGRLSSRPWQAAQRAAAWLAQLPALAELIRQLGRTERSVRATPPAADADEHTAAPPVPTRLVETRLPDAPGALVGVRFSASPERMLASEAVMLRHPVLHKLWQARHAEARLLSWDTEAVLVETRPDPAGRAARPQAETRPEALERGPILLCLDTSGSMRGAPENIAKAVVIAALRAAHEHGRACRLIAFGGPGELVERDLGTTADSLGVLLDLMAQSFDGGTDIQTPIERAIDSVHEARWRSADLLVVSDGEFGCVPATLARLEAARERYGLRVQGVLVGDRETLGLLEVCDHIHWVRDWRRYAEGASEQRTPSPVHSKSLTALYFPNALSPRAAAHHARDGQP